MWVWFRSVLMSNGSFLGKWHPLFPSHIDVSSTSTWDGPTYLDGVTGPKAPGIHKHQTEMQPLYYFPHHSQHEVFLHRLQLQGQCLPHCGISPKRISNRYQNQTKYLQERFPQLHSLVLKLFTQCLNQRLMIFSCKIPFFNLGVMQHSRNTVNSALLLKKIMLNVQPVFYGNVGHCTVCLNNVVTVHSVLSSKPIQRPLLWHCITCLRFYSIFKCHSRFD